MDKWTIPAPSRWLLAITGVAIMLLLEEGKLELRRPAEDYLPKFKGQLMEERLPNGNTAAHAPTHPSMVWHLMAHAAGLAGDPDGELSDNPRTLRIPLAEGGPLLRA